MKVFLCIGDICICIKTMYKLHENVFICFIKEVLNYTETFFLNLQSDFVFPARQNVTGPIRETVGNCGQGLLALMRARSY